MGYTALTNPSSDPIQKIFFLNGVLFAVTQNGTTFDDAVWASTDSGATWTDCGDFSLFSSGYRVRSITYCNGYYFIVRDGLAAYSASPTSGWALVNTSPSGDDAYSVAYFSGFYWIGCSSTGTVYKSASPGSGYASVSTGLGYGHEWLAVAAGRLFTSTTDYGASGAGVCSTADGATWVAEIADSQNRRLVTDGTVLFASRTTGDYADTLKFVSPGSWTAESACPDIAFDSNLFVVGVDLVAWGYPPGTRDTFDGSAWTQGFDAPPVGTSVTCSTTDGAGLEFVVFYDSGATTLYSYAPGGGPTFDTPLILTVDRSGSDVDYPLRLRVSTPEDVAYPLRLTVIDGATQGGLNGAGGWFAAPDGRWQGRVTVGGVDYSAMLVGTVTVRRAADESATAEFGFRHGGPIAPMGLVRQAVEIFFAGRGAAGEVINPQLLFRGVIDQPQVDVPRRMVQCLCSDRLQEAIDNTPREWIDSQIGGRYSAELSGAPDGNWRYAQERLASVPKSLALDVTGAPVVLPWRDVTRPLRVTEADQIDGSPTVTLPQASQVRTRIAVTAEYRYQVARNRGISSIWKREARWFINGPNGTDGPLDWLTTDMVEGALSSMEGWDLVSLEIEHPQPGDYSTGITIDAGVYTIKPEIAPSLAIGWIAHLFTAWQQTRTERYTLTVVDSALEAALGAPVSEEMGVTVTAPNMPPAWAADKTVTPRFAPAGLTSDIDAIQAALSGDTIYRHEPEIDGETPWQTFQAAALTLLDRARVRLWSAARSGRVRFSVPCRPDFFLWHRAEVETAQVHVEGDVVALTHTLDPERGTAVTEVDLAVGFPGNTAGGFAPLVLPDRPNPDAIPATSGPAGHFGGAATRQNWWVGGLPTSPQFNERQMLGYVTNSAKNALAPDADKAAMAWYPKQLTVEAPEVPAADRDPMEIPVAVEYPWSVPTDLLEVL